MKKLDKSWLKWIAIICVFIAFPVLILLIPLILAVSLFLMYYYRKKKYDENKYKRARLSTLISGGIMIIMIVSLIVNPPSKQNNSSDSAEQSSSNQVLSAEQQSEQYSKQAAESSKKREAEIESKKQKRLAEEEERKKKDAEAVNLIKKWVNDNGYNDAILDVQVFDNTAKIMITNSIDNFGKNKQEEIFTNIGSNINIILESNGHESKDIHFYNTSENEIATYALTVTDGYKVKLKK